MPCHALPRFWETNPRRWERCLRDAAAAMVAEGWPRKAGKFSAVQLRRARRLWGAA
jgi:hypothetical protein